MSKSFCEKPAKNGGYFLRKVTVRHEKKGWGVLDIAARGVKSMNVMPQRNIGAARISDAAQDEG